MNHATDIEAHRAWMARDRAKDTAKNHEACPCEVCGCLGNVSCGHRQLDDEKWCMLSAIQVCPCCAEVARVTKGAAR
jgi:hypothetical protein